MVTADDTPRVPVERLAYSVEEAAEVLGLSRNIVYNLIHRDDFPSMTIGKRRVISAKLLAEWVETQAKNRAVID